VGLKTKEELLNLKGAAEQEAARQEKLEAEEALRKEREERKRRKEKQKKTARLSFAMGGEEEEEEEEEGGSGGDRPTSAKGNKAANASNDKEMSIPGTSAGESALGRGEETLTVKKRKKLVNPGAETSYLRDPEAEKEEAILRERLKQEWLEEQDRIKEEVLEVTYSYWDGSGHRRVLRCKKGVSIGAFLQQVKAQVAVEFPDLRGISPDDMMYIKEDLIIPHNVSFYDLIVTKARGKSGPLFHFDVHDDVRLTMDARVEKDESHPGKVVDRKWYERNKHIFPASRWEVYDPKVVRGGYSIHGGEVQAKK